MISIFAILCSWECGYGLATGAWFEWLAFVAFVAVELLHIVSIEKSLLYHYGKEYYDYMKDKSAFFPCKCGKYLGMEMGLFDQCCICLCRFGDYDLDEKSKSERIPLKVHSFPHVDSAVLLTQKKKKLMRPSTEIAYGATGDVEAIND